MASVNKVIIVGNLGADPELRYTKNGVAVANFSVATNERWNDKNGDPQERTEWHRVAAWGKLGEICSKYLKKGRSVYVEGRLHTQQWEDVDGVKRFTTQIIAKDMQMLGPREVEAVAGDVVEPPAPPTEPVPVPQPDDEDLPF